MFPRCGEYNREQRRCTIETIAPYHVAIENVACQRVTEKAGMRRAGGAAQFLHARRWWSEIKFAMPARDCEQPADNIAIPAKKRGPRPLFAFPNDVLALARPRTAATGAAATGAATAGAATAGAAAGGTAAGGTATRGAAGRRGAATGRSAAGIAATPFGVAARPLAAT